MDSAAVETAEEETAKESVEESSPDQETAEHAETTEEVKFKITVVIFLYSRAFIVLLKDLNVQHE